MPELPGPVRALVVIELRITDTDHLGEAVAAINPPLIPHFAGNAMITMDHFGDDDADNPATAIVNYLQGEGGEVSERDYYALLVYWDGTISVHGEFMVQLPGGRYSLVDPDDIRAITWEYGVDDGTGALPVGDLDRAEGIQAKYGGVIKRRMVVGDMWHDVPVEETVDDHKP